MKLPNTETLLLDQDARGVLRITFNRVKARNAMNRAMLEELSTVFDTLAEDASIRAVVLRGAGGHFCAGGDLKEMLAGGGLQPPKPGEVDPINTLSRAFGTLLRKVDATPQVVIALCEGVVLGGGFGLACVSDIAIARADTRFGLPETSRGVIPAQIAPFLVQRIGLTQTRKLCLTGARFNGEQALGYGLVHEVVADEAAMQATLESNLKQVLNCAPQANAATKVIIRSVMQDDMETVLDDAARRFAQTVRGAEAAEGITAFIQKRPPKWAEQGVDEKEPT